MSLFLSEKDRRVIPRWRDFRTTAESGELEAQSSAEGPAVGGDKYFEQKLGAWQADRSIETAADVVASALVLGRHSDAVDAAHFLLEPGREPTSAVRAVAEQILSPEDQVGRVVSPEPKDVDIQAEVLRLRIRALRAQLRDTPRNAILWVDLARAYSMLGQRERSIRAMERALGLVHGDRFVLRSASRLFVHVDEPDRAHSLLIRTDRTREDPWLLAAEIAIATVAGRRPVFVKQGRQLLEKADFPALQTTELTSAIATLEMTAGDVKKARRLFRDSLIDPTDNSLAQAGWAATKISGVEVTPELLNKPRSFEARAFQEYKEGHWALAIRHCESWLLDESFSSRPAALGSYLAGVTEQDYRLSEDFARRGLRANPRDPLLTNNLVVALASQGRVEEAVIEFQEIKDPSDELLPTLLATQGLLEFRKGNPAIGRLFYLEAIARVRQLANRRNAALAALHLAREEVLSGTPVAGEAVKAAAEACKGVDSPELLHMLGVVSALQRG